MTGNLLLLLELFQNLQTLRLSLRVYFVLVVSSTISSQGFIEVVFNVQSSIFNILRGPTRHDRVQRIFVHEIWIVENHFFCLISSEVVAHSRNLDIIDCFEKFRLLLLLWPHIFYLHWAHLVNGFQIVIFSFGEDVSHFGGLLARKYIMARLFLVTCIQNSGMSLLHFRVLLAVHSVVEVWLDDYLCVTIAKAIHLILHGLLCGGVILGLFVALYNGNVVAEVLILGQFAALDEHSHGINRVTLRESLCSSQIACLVFILLWYVILIILRYLRHVQNGFVST